MHHFVAKIYLQFNAVLAKFYKVSAFISNREINATDEWDNMEINAIFVVHLLKDRDHVVFEFLGKVLVVGMVAR